MKKLHYTRLASIYGGANFWSNIIKKVPYFPPIISFIDGYFDGVKDRKK